jgi:hypothetical protein
MAGFASPDELKEVLDKTFALMSEDEDMGPKLKAADTPQRFEFSDLDLSVSVRPSREGEEGNLIWVWGEADFEPRVRMTMDSDTANRYFQGKENVPIALARRKIKAGGDVKAALALMPITKPVFERYRAMVESDYPHLVE